MSGLVSIVMPVYNGEKYLAEAIRSVIEQTYADWELIVVDDGSTDATPQIVAAAGDARIRYTHQANRGQAAALNRGLDLATGVYVTTLDADDRLTPNSLLDRVAWLEAHGQHDAVYADGYICDGALTPQGRFSQIRPQNFQGDIYPALISTPFFGTGACVLIRADLLHRWQIRYDESIVMCQDWDFYIRVAEHVQFGYVDGVSVFYRVHTTNMTLTVNQDRHIDSIVRTRFKILESPRFGSLESAVRLEFLRRLLVNTLRLRPADQEAVVDSSSVSGLSPSDRARLLRWLAAEVLITDSSADRAQELLRTARSLAPGDAKTAGMTLLVRANAGFAKRALWTWRHLRPASVLAQMRFALALLKDRPQTARTPVASSWQ